MISRKSTPLIIVINDMEYTVNTVHFLQLWIRNKITNIKVKLNVAKCAFYVN